MKRPRHAQKRLPCCRISHHANGSSCRVHKKGVKEDDLRWFLFQKNCVFFPWVGLGSDDKHKDIVVSDSEGFNLHRFQVFFKKNVAWLVGRSVSLRHLPGFSTLMKKMDSLSFASLVLEDATG